MPTYKENTIGENIKQFKWDDTTGVFSKKPEGMTDAEAMIYVNESRKESSEQDPRNKPRMTGAERAEQAQKELEAEKNKRNMGGVMRNTPTGFKGHF